MKTLIVQSLQILGSVPTLSFLRIKKTEAQRSTLLKATWLADDDSGLECVPVFLPCQSFFLPCK